MAFAAISISESAAALDEFACETVERAVAHTEVASGGDDVRSWRHGHSSEPRGVGPELDGNGKCSPAPAAAKVTEETP